MQSAPLFQSIPEIRIHRIHWGGGGGGGRGGEGGGEQRLSPSKYSPVPHNRSSIVIRWPRLQAVSDPLKLSCPPGPREINAGSDDGRRLLPLPVLIRRSGRASQYAWDGSRLRLVGLDDGKPSYLFPWSLRRLFSTWESTVRKLFVPQQVQAHYMDYLKWKLLHRIFSSALQVLATQAMFRAIGIGSSRSLPSAAALNWVLKDGLGRLSRCIYTASLGSAFDTNLKRVRFSTSILFSLSIGVELLTPAFPQYFLLLATTANIAKSISLAAYIATGSAIHRSFAIADNLGEVSAKAQIQTVCFDNLGLLLAASLNMLCKNNQRFQAVLPFVVYPIFSAVDLLAIYQGLHFVHLQTLTKDRLEIIIDTWIQLGVVPSPAEVSKKEGVYFSRKDSKLWPIRIGCADSKNSLSMAAALTLQFLSGKDLYFICTEVSFQDLMGKQQGILLCLREMAGTTDIIMGLLQACLIRKMLLREHSCNNIWEGKDADGLMVIEWFTVVEESKKCTWKEINHLTSEIKNAGWAVKNVLLKPKEQIRYSMVSDS